MTPTITLERPIVNDNAAAAPDANANAIQSTSTNVRRQQFVADQLVGIK